MKKLQLGTLLLLLGLMLGIIVACGGDTATVTPVPTNTPAATSTPAATKTPAPPTNTPQPPSPTAAPATNTPSAMPATSADMDLISQAVTATKGLKSYHAVVVASGSVFTQALNLEGDFIAPNQAYLKGTMGGQQIEEIATGGKTYMKNASGKWEVQAASGSSGGSGSPVDLTGNASIVSSLSPLLSAGAGYMDVGQDTLDGTTVRHFTGKIDAGSLMGAAMGGAAAGGTGAAAMSLGTVELWIDPSTKYIHKVSMALDLSPLMALLGQMAAAFGGTPGPGTPTATPLPATMTANISVTLSKINDSSITIPAAPADAVPAPTGTAAPSVATAMPSGTTPTTGTSGAAATDTPAAGSSTAATPAASGPAHKVGESVTVAKFKVTVKGLKEVPAANGITPGDGMRFVGVAATFENTSGQDSTVSATLEATLKDSTGASYSSSLTGAVAVGGTMAEATVTTNKTLDSTIVFEVPTAAKGFQFIYKDFVTDASAAWDLGQ